MEHRSDHVATYEPLLHTGYLYMCIRTPWPNAAAAAAARGRNWRECCRRAEGAGCAVGAAPGLWLHADRWSPSGLPLQRLLDMHIHMHINTHIHNTHTYITPLHKDPKQYKGTYLIDFDWCLIGAY